MVDFVHEALARLETEIAEDLHRTHARANRLYEMAFDSREAISKLYDEHAARVAPLQAQRETIIMALATVRALETPAPVILPRS